MICLLNYFLTVFQDLVFLFWLPPLYLLCPYKWQNFLPLPHPNLTRWSHSLGAILYGNAFRLPWHKRTNTFAFMTMGSMGVQIDKNRGNWFRFRARGDSDFQEKICCDVKHSNWIDFPAKRLSKDQSGGVAITLLPTLFHRNPVYSTRSDFALRLFSRCLW